MVICVWKLADKARLLQACAVFNKYGDDWHHLHILFLLTSDYKLKKDFDDHRIFMDKDINDFLDDVYSYKKYITESLNDIEVEIYLQQT